MCTMSGLPYDPGFALRTCMENSCLQATIYLLKSLGLYEQAVEEALAKVCLHSPSFKLIHRF